MHFLSGTKAIFVYLRIASRNLGYPNVPVAQKSNLIYSNIVPHHNTNEKDPIQKKKIAYFFTQIGDIDYLRADRYLSKVNLDEKLAVKYFHDIHHSNPLFVNVYFDKTF